MPSEHDPDDAVPSDYGQPWRDLFAGMGALVTPLRLKRRRLADLQTADLLEELRQRGESRGTSVMRPEDVTPDQWAILAALHDAGSDGRYLSGKRRVGQDRDVLLLGGLIESVGGGLFRLTEIATEYMQGRMAS